MYKVYINVVLGAFIAVTVQSLDCFVGQTKLPNILQSVSDPGDNEWNAIIGSADLESVFVGGRVKSGGLIDKTFDQSEWNAAARISTSNYTYVWAKAIFVDNGRSTQVVGVQLNSANDLLVLSSFDPYLDTSVGKFYFTFLDPVDGGIKYDTVRQKYKNKDMENNFRIRSENMLIVST